MSEMKFRPQIRIEETGEYVGLSQELSLLDVLLSSKIPIAHSCGGNGTCGTCLCKINSNLPLPLRNELESEMAEERNFRPEERLACQVIIYQDCELSEYNS